MAELTEDQWLDLASRHANADWDSRQPDGFLNAVKALCADFAAVSPEAAQHGAEPSDEITEQDAYDMGAKGAPPSDRERLLFEAWMRGHCWALSATWDGKQYRSDAEQGGDLDPRAMATRRLFAAWRDRAALPVTRSAPAGYKLVMVPEFQPADEPDWDECIRQAEVATGLKVERHTLSIVIREVRRWLIGRAAAAGASAKQPPDRPCSHGTPPDVECLRCAAPPFVAAGVPEAAAPQCNPHPSAPHGFNRNASHNAGRYVCDCEGWTPPQHDPIDTSARPVESGAGNGRIMLALNAPGVERLRDFYNVGPVQRAAVESFADRLLSAPAGVPESAGCALCTHPLYAGTKCKNCGAAGVPEAAAANKENKND